MKLNNNDKAFLIYLLFMVIVFAIAYLIENSIFPDGKVATYSYRAWGDLMAAVWSTEDEKDYSYMSFYM